MYGCDLAPYKLPMFLLVRIFALEYISQMINVDGVHFVVAKKKSQFRVKPYIGPFICNKRVVGEEAYKDWKKWISPIVSHGPMTHGVPFPRRGWKTSQQPIFTLKGLKLKNTWTRLSGCLTHCRRLRNKWFLLPVHRLQDNMKRRPLKIEQKRERARTGNNREKA